MIQGAWLLPLVSRAALSFPPLPTPATTLGEDAGEDGDCGGKDYQAIQNACSVLGSPPAPVIPRVPPPGTHHWIP